MAGILARFFGRTVSEGAAFAAGIALGPTLAPVVRELENTTWASYPVKPPAAVTLATGVAQGQVDEKVARQWAKETGYGEAAFSALIDIANVGPGVAVAFELWRRGVINEAGFRRAALRVGLESEWIDDLVKIKELLLTPAELAVMIQRGIVPDPGILPVGPPTSGGRVPAFPVTNLDALVEAAGSGIDRDRLAAMVGIIGLPASPDLAARMVFRGIIDRTDFDRAIAEGNTRNEWAKFLFDGFRQITTVHDGIEGRLRGWLTDAEMYAETARHGMSKADTDLLFKINGRPLSWHQVFIGLRRGGKYDGPVSDLDPAFLKALQESNMRPEWYNLAWAQRYSYPAAFVLRGLTQSGDLSEAEAHQILLYEGWEPTLAAKVSARWAGGTGTTGDAHTGKAQTQLWTTLHRSYIASETDAATARTTLGTLALDAAAVDSVLALWDAERALIRAQLSPAQVKKAYGLAVLNPATGVAWTKQDALDALAARGYNSNDANTLLEE